MELFLFIGFLFSPLAAACAFIITYDEYRHHFLDKRKPLMHAFSMAVITFIIFLAISLLAGFLLTHFFVANGSM